MSAVEEPGGGEGQRIRLLLVEDDDELGKMIQRKLTSDGMAVELVNEPFGVIKQLEEGVDNWDVVVMDVGLPGMSGIDLLARFRQSESLASVIMLTGDNTAATAATCIRGGAFHYVTKPFRPFELSTIVTSAARHSAMRRELANKTGLQKTLLVGTVLGDPPAARRDRSPRHAERLDPDPGRERHRARSLSRARCTSAAIDKAKRFVALNCGAIPDSLIDSELFGHAKGAFTGALSDRAGVFVEADGGTLFLDEIGDMPLGVQARLLRVLQEGEVRPVGGSGTRQIDVRVVTATHVDLQLAVEQKRFREDLCYRLNVVVLQVPPLRERLDVLPLLTAHFMRKHGGSTPPSIAPAALEALSDYTWPGNVRELENAIVHAIALHHGDTIDASKSLPKTDRRPARASRQQRTSQPGLRVADDGFDGEELVPLTEAKRRASTAFEKRYLLHVIQRAKGSVSEAARLAQLDRTNFRRLLQRHGIDATHVQDLTFDSDRSICPAEPYKISLLGRFISREWHPGVWLPGEYFAATRDRSS